MLWKDCMPNKIYQLISKQETFSYLNETNVFHPKIADIVWKFICEETKQLQKTMQKP